MLFTKVIAKYNGLDMYENSTSTIKPEAIQAIADIKSVVLSKEIAKKKNGTPRINRAMANVASMFAKKVFKDQDKPASIQAIMSILCGIGVSRMINENTFCPTSHG